MERPIAFRNEGAQLVGILHLPDGAERVSGVVLCHGFTGNRTEAHWIFGKLARRLCADGFAVLRFDFRGSGDSEGRFQDMTISGEVSDALRALEVLASEPAVDRERIGILGLSLGGCVAALAAGQSPLVRATVLWAPVADPDVQFSRFLGGDLPFPCEFAPGFLLGRAFVDELPRLDPEGAIAKTRGPVLILHGAADTGIPAERSEAYARSLETAGVPYERTLIEGADHTFSGVGFEEAVIDWTAGWLRDNLAGAERAETGAEPARKPSSPKGKPITYADAGVDIEKANETKKRLKELVRASYTPQVLTELGSFGGLFAADFPGVAEPVLVASADGVGTKLKVAVLADRHDTVGHDIVNHCVNDILVMGARPLFFMDYLALGAHRSEVVAEVVGGVATACAAAGCALLGGETAEMPDVYRPGEYDLAGTIVGVVDRGKILDGRKVSPGDVVLGLTSDGLHTNGYSLARRLAFEVAGWTVDTYVDEWGATVGDAFLRPHRSYLRPLWPLIEDGTIHALAHITGGGITDNVPRVLPAGCAAAIDTGAWPVPPIFATLVRMAGIDRAEAYRTFNMGIGMVAIVGADRAEDAVSRLRAAGECVRRIGAIVRGDRDVRYA